MKRVLIDGKLNMKPEINEKNYMFPVSIKLMKIRHKLRKELIDNDSSRKLLDEISNIEDEIMRLYCRLDEK